jgi:hypothetical protein
MKIYNGIQMFGGVKAVAAVAAGGGGTTFTPSSYGDVTALSVVKDGAGYKYISAQRANWAVPADYDILEALPSGTVFTVVLTGGTYTFTTTSKGGTPGTSVFWYGEFSPTISGTVFEAPSSITFGGGGGGATFTSYNLTGGVDYPNNDIYSAGVSAMQGPSVVGFQYYISWTNTAAATATQNLPAGTVVTFTSGVNTYVGTITELTGQELVTEPTSTLYSISWASGPGVGNTFIPDSVSFTIYSIVQTGLQVNLASAPRTGSTWTDATGNGYNATLQGSPSYVRYNGGGIRLNNEDSNGTDYISVPYNISSSTVTVEVIAKFNPTSFWGAIWGNEIYDTNGGYLAYMDSATNISYGIPNSETTETITDSNAIRQWIFVINGTQASLFLNGSQIGTTDTINNQTLFATGGFQFGSRFAFNNGTGFGDTMNNSNSVNYPVFYQMRVYNKALSGAEITQNYNAVKATFGI